MRYPGGVRVRGSWGVMVFNALAWQRILQLALSYGWLSVLPAPDRYQVGDTFVTQADALSLADALERSLPDIPDHQAVATASENRPAISELRRMSDGITLVEWFSGETKENIRNFIQFCRIGNGFEIS